METKVINSQNESPEATQPFTRIAKRFRGFLPVVVDVETAGFNAKTDALLEIAAVLLKYDADGQLHREETVAIHVQPFEGANLDQASLAFNGIDPHHPFRFAVSEEEALKKVFSPIRKAIKTMGCSRAMLIPTTLPSVSTSGPPQSVGSMSASCLTMRG